MYYVNYPGYYYNPYYQNTVSRPDQQFPPVDSKLLYQSANEMKRLMEDAGRVLDVLSESEEFGTELMNAAQASNMKKVEQLIQSTGITSEVDISYDPGGLRLEFNSKVNQQKCCRLLVSLRWR